MNQFIQLKFKTNIIHSNIFSPLDSWGKRDERVS